MSTGAPQLLLNLSVALDDKLRVSNSPIMLGGAGCCGYRSSMYAIK